jgi:hypothetical protein
VLGSIEGGTDKCVRPGAKEAAKFAHHRNESNWETLTECRKIARLCAHFKAYTGQRAWMAVGDKSTNTMLPGQV